MMTRGKKNSYPKVILKTFISMWKAAPVTLVVFLAISLIYSVMQFIEIYGTQVLFDSIADFAKKAITFKSVLQIVVIVGMIFLISPVIEGIQYIFQGHLYRRTDCYLQSVLYKKTAEIRLIDFELPETFNTIKKAVDGSGEVPSACRGVLNICVYYIPFFIFTSVYFISVKPTLIFAVVFIFIPVLISELVRASAFYKLEGETVHLRRKSEYYESCIDSREYFKETRTGNAFKYFYNLYLKYVGLYAKESWKTGKRVAKIDALLGIANIVGYAGILFLLVYYLLKGDITVGIFAAVYYSIEKFYNISQELISELGSIMQDVMLGSYLYDFLGTEERQGVPKDSEKAEEIKLDNVYFHYPNVSNDSLQNINLTIKAGETLAIVGENGAGKTTLTKIIMGLYEPTRGKVYIGGKDISQYSVNTAFKSISAVFQLYQKYQMTLEENVAIGDFSSNETVDSAIKKSGIMLNRENYPEGIYTMLSREFNGVDLSGGQWQRVAIARGLYRKHSLILLDEPTSAIDPLEETKIYNKFIEVVRGKTAVLVTHRLGSARIADRIIVMDKGKIVEIGTHSELLRKRGYYYNMYSMQAEWYDRK